MSNKNPMEAHELPGLTKPILLLLLIKEARLWLFTEMFAFCTLAQARYTLSFLFAICLHHGQDSLSHTGTKTGLLIFPFCPFLISFIIK